jgi:hypothetical protein
MENNTAIYINGLGNVSPQRTTDNQRFLDEVNDLSAVRLSCLDPNYRDFISPDLLRRMGRLIRMGIASANIALKDAGCDMPDSIITGTGLGCMEDTEKFLSTLIRNKEEFLTPTSFIQSTHNTVSAQIALLLKCHAYNFTYVHRGWSFESALFDSLLRIRSGKAGLVLTGGMDELTQGSFQVMNRMGMFRRKPCSTFDLLKEPLKGSLAGEGSAFFLLSAGPSANSYARLDALKLFRLSGGSENLTGEVEKFLGEKGFDMKDLDVLVLGLNGDFRSDLVYSGLKNSFPAAGIAAWKHLSGEYPTSSAFGLWLSSMIMKHGRIPGPAVYKESSGREVRNILLYNHYMNQHHSLILLSKP